MLRLREIVVARDDARAAGYDVLQRATRFFAGMHPESLEGQMLAAMHQMLSALDDEREPLFALISGQGVHDDSQIAKNEPPQSVG